jgi:hypothetical protein
MLDSAIACKHCHCAALRRSHWRIYEMPLYLFGLMPVRCNNCNLRSYLNRSTVLYRPSEQEPENTRRAA